MRAVGASLRVPLSHPGSLAVIAFAGALVVPALAYTLIGTVLPGSISVLQDLVATAYLITGALTLVEARAALGNRDEPALAPIDDPLELAKMPMLAVIVSAYLPNEQELVAETIASLATELRTAPGRLQIILAYNTPEDMPEVEAMLAGLAELHVAFTALRVPSSRSKAENINAALGFVQGEVTMLLDADHRPAPDAAIRALRWFAQGYDIVQGRCAIRDHDTNWLARIVAVEFEEMYTVAHAGRSLAFDTALFGGSNGWWRTSVLRRIGMHSEMLTEDIDASVRALLAGYRTIHDRSIVSTELAPPSMAAWWRQRIRWAQGWFQVTLRHQRAIRRSPLLSSELKVYWSYLLGWRQLFPVLSLQIFALLLADLLLARRVHWFDNPFLLLTTVITLIAGPLVTLCTYQVASAARRNQLRRSFWVYAAGAFLFTTVKNTVSMVASFRELIGQRTWVVTQRVVAAGAVVAVGALSGFLTPQARAATDGPTILPLAPLASTMTLVGRVPVTTFVVPVPHDWTSLSGRLHLRWWASPSVTANSTISVRINGALVAAQPLRAGMGGMDEPIPAQAIAGHTLRIELDGQLHTEIGMPCCKLDPASDAIVALNPNTSSVTLTGSWSSGTPSLADVPGSLVDVLGRSARPLYVVLPSRPDGADVRAAALLAGAVDRSAGLSVPIKVVLGASAIPSRGPPREAVSVIPTGNPEARVQRQADGHLILTVTGSGGGVVGVATALAGGKLSAYARSAAAILTDIGSESASPPATQVSITAGGARGTGPHTVGVPFRLPEWLELQGGGARLEVGIGFSAPAGGRIDLALNGIPLRSINLPEEGASQRHLSIRVVQDPAQADGGDNVYGPLYPGDNLLTISGELPAGQPLGGAGDAEPASLEVLPSSTVNFDSQPRTGPATLGLWPWPYLVPRARGGATFLLPPAPTPSELEAVISTIATASLWTTTPPDPSIVIGPHALPSGNVVVIARGLRTPVALPAGAPSRPQPGLIETYASGGRHLLVAFGLLALRPLGSGYQVGKVSGIAAVVAPDGVARTTARAPTPMAFPPRPLPWKIPAAVLVVVLLGFVVLRVRRARRRLEDLPPVSPPLSPRDEVATQAQVQLWERLVANDREGVGAGDPASTA